MICGQLDTSGQSTVEYALVTMAFLGMLLALAAVWHVCREGDLLELAHDSSAHELEGGVDVGLLQDLTSY